MTSLRTLLPPSSSKLQRDLEEVFANRIALLGKQGRDVTKSDISPEHILPWLAWEMSVDVWNDNWAVEIRREVIKASLFVHKKKGTIGALKKALGALQIDGLQLEEWFEYGGNPYTFRVFIEIISSGFDLTILDEIFAIIINSKNVRSHLESLKAYLTTKSSMPYIGVAVQSGEVVTLHPKEYATTKDIRGFTTGVFCSGEITTIKPKYKSEHKVQIPFIGATFVSAEIITIKAHKDQWKKNTIQLSPIKDWKKKPRVIKKKENHYDSGI